MKDAACAALPLLPKSGWLVLRRIVMPACQLSACAERLPAGISTRSRLARFFCCLRGAGSEPVCFCLAPPMRWSLLRSSERSRANRAAAASALSASVKTTVAAWAGSFMPDSDAGASDATSDCTGCEAFAIACSRGCPSPPAASGNAVPPEPTQVSHRALSPARCRRVLSSFLARPLALAAFASPIILA